MGVRIHPCYRCPLRKGCPDRERWAQKVQGLGLTAARFKCPRLGFQLRLGRRIEIRVPVRDTKYQYDGVAWKRAKATISAVQSLRDRAETFRIRMEIAEDNLTKVCIQRDQAKAELAATSKWLGELLAIIHRDGGHYSQERGWQKSVNDAHLIWADLIGKAEELAALKSRPEGRVVTAEALQDAMQFIAGKGLKVELNDARRVLELLGPILSSMD